ncbi:MAG: ATP-dependent DNA helicase RecQ [Candidatus Aphodosoma sp.]
MENPESAGYLKILRDNWGYDAFRPMQADIIGSVCSGCDTLAILPTGGGKSVTFQVPALAMDGVTVVISPLIALMLDQVRNLRRRGIRAAVLHSGLRHHQILDILEQAELGAYRLLYVSPERLVSPLFVKRLNFLKIALIAVDEAHCVSEWGYDFRPSYLKIADLRKFFPDIPLLALTASSTPDVTADIIDKLQMRSPAVFRAGVERDNLTYVVRETADRDVELLHILRSVPGTAIVYTRSRDHAEQVAGMLGENGILAGYYHAGLDSEARAVRQQQWMEGGIRVLCATNAFGMGIDKPDVRLVVHYDIPDALEAYYQEAGRAGRDGQRAYAVLLTTSANTEALLHRHERMFPSKEFVRAVYQHLANYYVVGVGSGEGAVYPFVLEDFCHKCHLSYGAAQSAVNVLQWAGYITVTDEMENASKLKILMNPQDLFEWRMENPQDDNILECIMRLYTGIFTDPQHISETYIANVLKMADSTRVYRYLLFLHRMGIVSYVPFRRTPLLIYNTSRNDADTLYIPPAAYEHRMERVKQRLKAMYRYVTSSKCRTQELSLYFGQKDPEPCRHCDNCIARRHA